MVPNDREQPAGTIRPARADEARELGEPAFRSKAHWGYGAAFMEACREDLAVTEDDVTICPV